MRHCPDSGSPAVDECGEMAGVVLEDGTKAGGIDVFLRLRLRRNSNRPGRRRQGGTVLGERRLQPCQLHFFAVDYVLIGVVEVVMAHRPCARLMTLEKGEAIGGKFVQGVLEFGLGRHA